LPGANSLAYLASSSAVKKKSFITMAPGVYVVKLFSFQSQNKARAFLPKILFLPTGLQFKEKCVEQTL
jgi:hypothetical protein